MNLSLSSPLVFLLVLALGGCVTTNPKRISLMNGPDYVFTQSRGKGVMPRAQACMGPMHFEARVMTDRARRVGR